VTLLAGRELIDERTLPAAVARRYYDEETVSGDAFGLAPETRRLLDAWWPAREAEPGLVVDGVWLPDVMSVSKALLLRLEVVEYVGVIERVLDEVKPDRVTLVTGSSPVEKSARALAAERNIPTRVEFRFPPAMALAAVGRWLRWRGERRALRELRSHSRRPVPDSKVRYLFSVSHARHFMMVNPLTRALHQRGFPCRVVASTRENQALDAPLRRLATDDGIAGTYFMDYVPPREAARLVRDLRPLIRRLRRTRPGARPSLDPILAPYRRDAVNRTLATARLYLAAAFRILDAHRPAAVVITTDRRMSERALALAARVRGIPTLLYWGGAILGRDRTNLFDVADRVLVLGDHVKTALAEHGVEEARLVAIGDPRSDAVRRSPPEAMRAAVRADLGLTPDRPFVVLVSKYVSFIFSASEKEAFFLTVRDATRALGGASVVVKAHPNEDLALLRTQLAGWGWPEVRLTQDYDIHRLFAAADVAVMVTSMAGIEAMALGCPVVAVQKSDKSFEGQGMPPYVSVGAVELVAAGDAEGLARALRRLVTDPAAHAALAERGRAFAARYIHPVDGALGDRFDALVESLGRERSR
jgi:glycosyltransferase involved in cell wall biosynthesis